MSETQETRERERFPLAYDLKGDPIKLPPNAATWRVKRGGGRRGRPSNIFKDGHQLEIPIGAGIDDLIAAGCPSDRYLLYPVDAEGRVVPGIVAVTEVPPGYEDDNDQGPNDEVSDGDDKHALMLATIRAQSETLCKVVEALASGYGYVRPAPPQQAAFEPQTVVTQAPAESPFKPEQLMQIMSWAKMAFDMFKGGAVDGVNGAAAGATPDGGIPGAGGGT